jgi:hypothetical protein
MQRLTEGFANEQFSWQAESAGCTQVAAEEKELAFSEGDQRRGVVFRSSHGIALLDRAKVLSIDKEHVA